MSPFLFYKVDKVYISWDFYYFMTGIIVKSQIRKKVKEIDEENVIGNVATEVEEELEIKINEILEKAIQRAKANQRKTLLARDLWLS